MFTNLTICLSKQKIQNHEAVCSPTDKLYDTPKQLNENLKSASVFENYDVPQSASNCSCQQHRGPAIRSVYY